MLHEFAERRVGFAFFQMGEGFSHGAARAKGDLGFDLRCDETLFDPTVIDERGNGCAARKSADVRPEGYAAIDAERLIKRRIKKLLQEPEGKHHVSRNLARSGFETEEKPVDISEAHFGFEVPHHKGAHDARDCA